jgi:hypothetical protein
MGIQINTQPQVFTSLSSSAISATNLFNNSGIDIISRTNTLFTTVTGITGSSLTSPSLSAQTLTAGSGVFNTSISATAISAVKFYGDGSELKNIAGVGAGVTSINGLTGVVTNVAFTVSANNFTQGLTGTTSTFLSSVSSPAISAVKFYGDGSELKNIAGVGAGVTSINGLTGVVTNVVTTSGATLTGNLLAPALSSQTLTAGTGIFNISVSAAGVSGTNFYTTSAGGYLSGGNNLTSIFGAKSTVDSTYSTVNTNSANWNSSYTTVQGNSADWTLGKTLSTNGGRIGGDVTVAGRLTTNYITALSGSTFVNTTFTTTSSLCVVNIMAAGPALYVGASGSGDIASFYDTDTNVEVLHIGGANGSNPNVGVKTSTPNKDFTVFGEISASGNAWFNDVTSNNNLTAKQATFTISVSSSAVSGTNFHTTSAGGYLSGGNNLTSIFGAKTIVDSTFTTVSGITANRLNTPILSSQTLTALSATFTASVSSPAISGTNFYTTSAGGYLSGGTNLTGIFGAKTIVDSTFTTVSGITANRLNTPILSSQTLSSNTLILSGYPITPVTTVYSVANGATATYTVALSDNNNTITLNLGTSGIVVLSSTIAYPVGFQTNIIQLSTGRITLSGSGITLNNDLSSYRTYGRYSAATIINLGSTWVCYGSLSS